MAFGLSSLTTFLKKEISLSAPKSAIIGVDIGASAIKVVQLKNVKNTPTLETYGELQLGPYESTDIGRCTHPPSQKVVEALTDIMREAGVTSTVAGVAFSYSSSFTQGIRIPTLDQHQLEAMLPVEARKYIPLALSKVTLDWIPLEVYEHTKETAILMSALFTESVERYNTIIQSVPLENVVQEIEIFSTIRSTLLPEDTVSAIVDLGASSTRLYIVKNGLVRKTHSIPLSGEGLTRTVSSALSVDFTQGEEIKRMYGLSRTATDERIAKVLGKEIDRGLREIHAVITQYEQNEKTTVKKIVLSGGGALIKDLRTRSRELFSKEVHTAQPFDKVAYPAFLEDTLAQAGPSFAVAIGVALRAFHQE